jgi:hypothetical protein
MENGAFVPAPLHRKLDINRLVVMKAVRTISGAF